MAFVSGRCPNCGGEIHLDGDKEKGFCLHCGSPIQVRDAVARLKVEHSGSVQLSGVATDQSLVKRGYMEIENGNPNDAFFDDALRINPDNYLAWKGKFECRLLGWQKSMEITTRPRREVFLAGIYLCYGYSEKITFDNPYTENAVAALATAIKTAPADKKADLLKMQEQYVTTPLRMLQDANTWLKKGRCLHCGGAFSLLGKCKECGNPKGSSPFWDK